MTAITSHMENLSLKTEPTCGIVPLANKRNAGKGGVPINLIANIMKIDLLKKTPIYKYDVNIILTYQKRDGSLVDVEVSKSPRKDTSHLHDLEKCKILYQLVTKKHEKDFPNGQFFYDRQASLYAFKKIKGAEAGLKYVFEEKEVPKIADIVRASVTIKNVENSFQSTSDDIPKTINSAPKLADKTLLEALNTIINGPAVENENVITYKNSTHYLLDPSVCGFRPSDFLDFPEGCKYSGVGLKTAVKTLEGNPNDKSSLYLVTEIKKSLFHYDNVPLLEKLEKGFGFNESFKQSSPQGQLVLKSIKGLQCYLNYGKNKGRGTDAKIVKISGFGPPANSPASNFKLKDGKLINVADYFKKEYNIILKRPGLLTVEARSPANSKCCFPIELLNVAESQIAKTEQLSLKEQDRSIRESAMLPSNRKDQTEKVGKAVGVIGANIGNVVKVASNMESVPGRVLAAPKMVYSGNKVAMSRNQSSWQAAGTFVDAAKLKIWQFVAIGVNFNYNEYVKRLVDKARRSGMEVALPQIITAQNGSTLKKLFSEAHANKVQMLFFVTRDRDNLHMEIKSLEQEYDVLTQEVRETKARETLEKNQNQTLENVVNKLNIKLGGLNFSIAGVNGNTFTANPSFAFIGFETSQRASSDMPIMIGYASNILDHPQKYAGGYYYVKKNEDVFGPVIKNVIRKVITKVAENRQEKPKHLVVYFNGVSEGQWAMINEIYVKQIKDVCKEFIGKVQYQPHITVLAVSKIHNERIYKKTITGSRASEQNIPPGTVVDQKIVSPVINEFYLTAQNAFQGTAKSPKFSLIFDSSNMPMEILETITYQLCFLHEIVNATVSLPAPLLIADRFARRASMVFMKKKDSMSVDSNTGEYDFEKLNRELGYEGKNLDFSRFNA